MDQPEEQQVAITPPPPDKDQGEHSKGEQIQPSEGMMIPMKDIIMFIIIVLFVGVAAIFVAIGGSIESNLAQKSATYQDLRDKVLEQNALIQAQNQKIDAISKKLKATY